MSTHFSLLRDHRLYVLRLYRYTLRTTRHNINSIIYRNHILDKVKERITNNRLNKSSWAVHNLLEKLESLNCAIQKNDYNQVRRLLTDPKVDPNLKLIKTSINEIKLNAKPPQQDPKLLIQSNILDKYMKIKQSDHLLPAQISKKIKRNLLLPIALDWHSRNKIDRIQKQLDKGIPEVYLSYTKAGPSTIWFVRSPVNKQKAQSRKLSSLISKTKKENQDVLDGIVACEKNAQWALSEAIWEEYLANENLPNFNNISELLSRVEKIEKTKQLVSSTVVTNNLQYKDGMPVTVLSWLSPISNVITELNKSLYERAASFEKFKKEVLLKDGHVEYYKEKTATMHLKRKKRFENMLKNDIPNAFTFEKDHNLYSILENNKF
ncbi:similar to Saccharomyces cerevisiae YDR065W RRG1 Protein of unknown function, required for vacuolar acidification and mitochondrial genome maintenance [Maudiozyma barnettii]|uniref:Required for respiratory growth protein 1, mitochondrial n=1 Tax=Maudiozyma barnettii TaxID=61262 RepID=A0A8H2VJS6_9SACH|nr:Rrg1p [Kazachstania barnettii]CAB4256589.1 similar to Saccharomyces cerevisiae YDR065W RRG1 Protein of unknown function, required for vacuolar acidification and mitochondrial genome maintenance [Kazachstania barnettii]CAD1785192.1 similar to Saccharomyces cerevisiae YDR065W RRG1 Protein of unknown function, required for vacuolar acidification and mitochondrial genome maintenance [Kazachstania barnettii]